MQIFANLHLDISGSNYSMNSKAFAKIFKCQTSMRMYIEKVEAILKKLHEKEISAESNKRILPNVCSNASCRACNVPLTSFFKKQLKARSMTEKSTLLFFVIS